MPEIDWNEIAPSRPQDDLARQDLGVDSPLNVLPQKFIMHPDLPGGIHMWDRDDAAGGQGYYHAERADQLGLDRIQLYETNGPMRAGYVERRGDAWHPFPAYRPELSDEDADAAIAKANERTGLNWPAYEMEPLPELPTNWDAPPAPKTSAEFDWTEPRPPERPQFYEGAGDAKFIHVPATGKTHFWQYGDINPDPHHHDRALQLGASDPNHAFRTGELIPGAVEWWRNVIGEPQMAVTQSYGNMNEIKDARGDIYNNFRNEYPEAVKEYEQHVEDHPDWYAAHPPEWENRSAKTADYASQMPQPEQIRGPEPDPGYYEGPPYEWTDEQTKNMGGKPLPQSLYYGDTDTQRHFKFLTPHTGEAVFGQNAWVWPVDGRDGFPWHMHKRDQINRDTGQGIGSHTHTNGYGTVLPDGTHMLTDGELRYEQHHDALQDAMKAYGVKSISSADTRDPTDQDWEDAETWAAPSPPPPPGLDRPTAKTASPGEWDMSGDDPRWVQPHDELLADALHSWKGDPSSMGIHMHDAMHDPEHVPSAGSGKMMRAQAEALLHELQENGKPNPVRLYRGSHVAPVGHQAWSENRATANLFAKKNGGQVHTLEPGQGRGIRIADYIKSGADENEQEWIIDHGQRTAKTAMPVGPMPDNITYKLLGSPERQQCLYADTPEFLEQHMHAAYICWYSDGEIKNIYVQPELRRLGLATELLNRAREINPNVHHSDQLSEDAQGWSQAVAKTANPYANEAPWFINKQGQLIVGGWGQLHEDIGGSPDTIQSKGTVSKSGAVTVFGYYTDDWSPIIDKEAIYREVAPQLAQQLGIKPYPTGEEQNAEENLGNYDFSPPPAPKTSAEDGWDFSNPQAPEQPAATHKFMYHKPTGNFHMWPTNGFGMHGGPHHYQMTKILGWPSPGDDNFDVNDYVQGHAGQSDSGSILDTYHHQGEHADRAQYLASQWLRERRGHEDKHHPKHKHLVDRLFNDGGFTVDPDLNEAPTDGYYVSQSGGDVIPADDFSADDIARKQGEVEPGQYIGAWLDNGHVYLDTTHRFDDLGAANDFGAHHSQQALWDANDNQVLPVVARPKTRSETGDDWTVMSKTAIKTAVLDSFDAPMTGEPNVVTWEDDGYAPEHHVRVGDADVQFKTYADRQEMMEDKEYDDREFGPVQGPFFYADNGNQPVIYVEMIGNGGAIYNEGWKENGQSMYNVDSKNFPGQYSDLMNIVRFLKSKGVPIYGHIVNPQLKELVQRFKVGKTSAYDSDPKMQQFFEDAGKGLRAPNRPLGPEDLPMSPDAQAFRQVWEQHAGPFDQHIETSIPGYAQNMAAKGVALTKAFPGSSVLDMAAGHGSFGKALAAHGMQTTNVDAAPHFRDSFEGTQQVPGAQFAQYSLSGPFTDANGNNIEQYPEGQNHDIVHEAMGFQFYSQDRERDVAQAKAHLNPGGLAIFDEKFTQTDPSLEQSNEATKDQWKLKHYPQADLDAKAQEVGLNDQWSTGMRSMQANQDEFEKVLARNFRFVKPYWKNGNFAGYACSDNPHTLTKYLDAYSQAAQAPSKAPQTDSQPHAASVGTTRSGWAVVAENGSEWPTLDQLHRPWADDHGYEPLDADGDWLMGGGCAHLALAMKNMWPEGKIASSWYDDHGSHALAHAAFYDPKSGHAWDGAGAHKYADVAISGHSGTTERNMDTDPERLAEHMGINYNPESPFEDDNVNDAAEFANRHFNPSYTPPDDEWLAHTSADFDFSNPAAPGPKPGELRWLYNHQSGKTYLYPDTTGFGGHHNDIFRRLQANDPEGWPGEFGYAEKYPEHDQENPERSILTEGGYLYDNGRQIETTFAGGGTTAKAKRAVLKAFVDPNHGFADKSILGDDPDDEWDGQIGPGPVGLSPHTVKFLTGHTKTAMPYHNNTWYHVTPQSYLPSIAERGLVPQTMGSSQQNWRNIPQDETAVYLHQNYLAAQAMARRAESVPGNGNYNVIPNWPQVDGKPDKAAILRITGIDRNQVVPDPESFQHTLEGWGEMKKWNDDHPEERDEIGPAGDYYMQDFNPKEHDYYEGDIPEAIHTVRDMHERFPDEMRDLAESHADDEGNPMMTLGGPVHPDNIEHVHMPTWEDWMDDFQPSDSAQRRIEHRDDYDMHDEEQRDWMDDNDYNAPPGDEAMMDDMEGDPADMAGDDYADYLRATPLRQYVKQRWPHTAGAREDFAGVPGWASVPKHVYNWLDQMYPDEQHGYESDCINPKCQHNWTDTERRELAQYGQVRCPECKLEQNREGTVGPWYDEAHTAPGKGGTHSGLTRTQQGDIGEQIVKRLGQLPSGPITEHYRDAHYNHPFDFRTEDEHGQPWAIEVKTNHSQTGPRFKWGGREEIEAKRNFAAQNGMRPALAGVRLNYFTNKADVFFRPQITDPYMSPQTMTHVGSVDFSDLNPFHDPASGQTNVPEMPVAAGAEDLPF